MNCHPPGQNGFTLMEMVLSIVLLGIAGVAAGTLIYQGTRSYEALSEESQLSDQAMLSLERVSRELRLMRCAPSGGSCKPTASIVPVMDPAELRFVNSGFEGRGLRADGGALLLRFGVGGADPEYQLASGISLTFDYLKADGTPAASPAELWTIGVNMSFSSGQSTMDVRAYVHPRDFK